MQRYNTREVDCHLLSFSIAKTSEKLLLNDRYSVSCGYEKTFQNLTLTFVRMEKMLLVNSQNSSQNSVTRDSVTKDRQQNRTTTYTLYLYIQYRYIFNVFVYASVSSHFFTSCFLSAFLKLFFLLAKAYILSFFVVTCHVSRNFTMDDKLIIQSVESGCQLFFLTIHWCGILEKNFLYIKLFLL